MKKLRSFVTKQRGWIGEIEEIEKNIYPELGSVKPKYIDKMVSMNKVLKDKPLKRFMEMAKWIAVIEVLE